MTSICAVKNHFPESGEMVECNSQNSNNTNATPLWLMLFKCPRTGSIYGRASTHNCTADYKTSPNFIGAQEIYVDLGEELAA